MAVEVRQVSEPVPVPVPDRDIFEWADLRWTTPPKLYQYTYLQLSSIEVGAPIDCGPRRGREIPWPMCFTCAFRQKARVCRGGSASAALAERDTCHRD